MFRKCFTLPLAHASYVTYEYDQVVFVYVKRAASAYITLVRFLEWEILHCRPHSRGYRVADPTVYFDTDGLNFIRAPFDPSRSLFRLKSEPSIAGTNGWIDRSTALQYGLHCKILSPRFSISYKEVQRKEQ